MTTFVVTTANWNDPSFWSGINLASRDNHALDFSGLPSTYTVDLDTISGLLTLSDGATTFTVGDNSFGGSPDASLGGATLFEYFEVLFGSEGDDSLSGGDDADTFIVEDGFGTDTIIGGEGGDDSDTIDLSAVTTGVTVTYSGPEAGNITNGTNTITFSEIENLILTNQDDVVTGSSGDDSIDAGDGNDSIDGGAGNDTLVGGSGNDTLLSGSGSDAIYAGTGDDSIQGSTGNQSIYIEDNFGNDTIDGGEGGIDFDYIDFTALTGSGVSVTYTGTEAGTVTDGSDTLTFSNIEWLDLSNQNDVVDASATSVGVEIYAYQGDDSLAGGSGTDFLFGFEGADTLRGGGGADVLSGGDGNDSIDSGDGNDSIDGGGGNDSIDGGDNDDEIYGGDGDDTIDSGEEQFFGDDDTVYGGAGNDTLIETETSAESQDTFFGGTGNDTLQTQGGVDTLYGGDDSDTFILSDGFGNDVIVGGEGGTDEDTIDLSALTSAVTVTYTGDEAGTITDGTDTITFSEIERLILTDQADVVDGSLDTAGLNIVTGDGDDTVYGGSGTDVIDSTDGGDNWFYLGTGDTTVLGGGGRESVLLNAGGGTLDYDGGGGINDYIFAGSYTNAGVTVTYSGGRTGTFSTNDGGLSSGTFTDLNGFSGTDNNDVMDASASASDHIEFFGRDGDDTLTGSSARNLLYGGEGNDTVDGGGGDDRLFGGLGNDTITAGTGDDEIVQTRGGGADVVTDFDITDTDMDGFFNDQIDVNALQNPDGSPVRVGDVTVMDDGSGNALLTFPEGETLVLQGVSPAQMSTNGDLYSAGIPCFTKGTRIATPDGDTPIENLEPGDLVMTREFGAQPIRWAKTTTLGDGAHDLAPNVLPVRIKPGVFGNERALVVSPQHCILMQDRASRHPVYVRAKHLAEETPYAAYARGRKRVTYYHILLPAHATVMSNGIPSESFYPGDTALRMLGLPAWLSLVQCFPGLTHGPVAQTYGPHAAPVMGRGTVRKAARLGQLAQIECRAAVAERSLVLS